MYHNYWMNEIMSALEIDVLSILKYRYGYDLSQYIVVRGFEKVHIKSMQFIKLHFQRISY